MPRWNYGSFPPASDRHWRRGASRAVTKTPFTSPLSITRHWSWPLSQHRENLPARAKRLNLNNTVSLKQTHTFRNLSGFIICLALFPLDWLAFLNANEVSGFPYKIALRPFDRAQFATLLSWHSLTNKIEFQTLLCWTDNLNLWPHPHIILFILVLFSLTCSVPSLTLKQLCLCLPASFSFLALFLQWSIVVFLKTCWWKFWQSNSFCNCFLILPPPLPLICA